MSTRFIHFKKNVEYTHNFFDTKLKVKKLTIFFKDNLDSSEASNVAHNIFSLPLR